MNEPLVSIIIPLYNRAGLIGETLDSVRAQTYEHWECIVVDDHSTDGSMEVVEKYCEVDLRIKLFRRPEERQKGANACRNYGFERSGGMYIQWFDSDDTMSPEKLETEIHALYDNPECDFVVSQTEMYDFEQNVSKGVYKAHQKSDRPFPDFVSGKIGFTTTGVLFKRSFLQGKPLFDETLFRAQEWEFFSRLLIERPNYHVLLEVLSKYRIHDNSISGALRRNDTIILRSEFQARKKIHDLLRAKELNYYSSEKFFLKRYASILIKSIHAGDSGFSREVMKEIFNRHFFSPFFMKVIKMLIGYISYVNFKRGYRLLKY